MVPTNLYNQLIDSIIQDVGVQRNHSKPVPAKATPPLYAFMDSLKFDLNLSHQSTIGKLKYLAIITR